MEDSFECSKTGLNEFLPAEKYFNGKKFVIVQVSINEIEIAFES